jgi:hypothetical protein
MKKKIINGILLVALVIATSSAFVSCKDNDSDVNTELLGKIAELQGDIAKLKQDVAKVPEKGDKGDQGEQGPQGIQGVQGPKGDDGKDGSVVTIGTNGNWEIDGVDTGIPAKGQDGQNGKDGQKGDDGKDGSVVTIKNGNWVIDGVDTGVPATGAAGKDAIQWTIGDDGYWYKDGEKTNYKAIGQDGQDGASTPQAEITALENRLKAIEDSYAKGEDVEDALEDLEDDINDLEEKIENALKKSVTSMTAEGTYNPVFGDLSAPVGVISHILAAYIGDGEAVLFPEDEAGRQTEVTKYVNNDAGTIYFTVNPNEVEIDANGFSLVNSQNEASPVTLKAAESDKVLTWGWHQTRNASGLWAADVTINDLQAVRFDVSNIAHSLKDAISNRTKQSIIDAIGDIYELATTEKFPRLALKYTWNDDFGTKTVRTGYDFGVASIKPLSYDFEVHIDKTPGLNKIENIFYEIIDKIEMEFPTVDIADDFKFQIKGIDVGTYRAHVWVDLNNDGARQDDEWLIVDLSDELQKFYDFEIEHINKDLDDVNDIIDQLRDFNNMSVYFDDAKQNIKDLIHDYFKKVDSKIVKLVNSSNKAVQPTLLVKTANDIRRPGPSTPAGKITLIPTSYTAEIIAPAIKKFVKVECDGQEITGENLGQVIDGSICAIDLNIESGKKYKVTYYALDYFGKERKNVYFITAK